MTATATALDAAAPTSVDDLGPSLPRLTLVELRKMVNTRSGFWLPIAVTLITVITVVVTVLNHGGRGATLAHVFHNAVAPAGLLLPVMGILLVCGEWTQRTTLQTFTLVPDRGRVLAAKLGASLAVALGAFAVCLACSAVFAELLSHASGGAGSISLAVLGQGLVFLAAAMVTGSPSAPRSFSRRRRSSPTCCCPRCGTRRRPASTPWPPSANGSTST